MLISKSFLVPKNLLDRLGLVHIQSVLLNISDDRIWQQILYRHPTSDKQADFCGGNIIVDELLDDKNVSPVLIHDIVG